MEQVVNINQARELKLWAQVVMADGIQGILFDRSLLPADSYVEVLVKQSEGGFYLRKYVPDQSGKYHLKGFKTLREDEVQGFKNIFKIDLVKELK